MRQGLGYFSETIFPALPSFYRRIDTALKQVRLAAALAWPQCTEPVAPSA